MDNQDKASGNDWESHSKCCFQIIANNEAWEMYYWTEDFYLLIKLG